ncbi:hypothetical protein L1S10_26325, partial [Klebsiella pneumoniae]
LFAGKKSAQIREILISESAWEEMTCLFAPSLGVFRRRVICQLIGSTVDGRHFCNISCFPFAPEALGTV